jgi:outer membrane protein assembly factor BamB
LDVPVITEEAVFVSSGIYPEPVQLLAFDRSTGTSKWKFLIPEEEYSPTTGVAAPLARNGYLTVGEAQVYLNAYGNRVYAISRTTGELCWKTSKIFSLRGDIPYSDGIIFVPGVRNLTALNAQTGEPLWKSSNKSGLSSPAVVDGTVYVGGEDGSLYALGARSGKQKWAFEAGDFTAAKPVVADGVVYAVSADGFLYAISTATGTKEWSYKLPPIEEHSVRPVVASGMIFLEINGGLLALG